MKHIIYVLTKNYNIFKVILRKIKQGEKMKYNHSEEKRSKLSQNEIPDDSFDMVNKYGTYEIQPSNDTDNMFPAISQGLAKKHRRKYK